ncbi:hypothetical protein FQ707_05880 [Bacteroidaceae bacterium HV4-6-C5C]|jgi:hypothetical protein|nr:hypothetical protein FQ707_05880 [Bacteroidaceae bacterium HV4-6-C5C]
MICTSGTSRTIYSFCDPSIAFRSDIKNIILGLGLFLFGFLFFIIAFKVHLFTSLLRFFLLIAGIAFLLCGIYQLLWHLRKRIYVPTGSSIKNYSFFFDDKYSKPLLQMFNDENWEDHIIYMASSTGSLRLDFLVSLDRKFIAMQLLRYVGTLYLPITSVYYFVGDDASDIIASLLVSHAL